MGLLLDRRRVITIFPERAGSLLSAVVLLGGARGDELHATGNLAAASILDEQVHVVGGDHVVEHTKCVSLPCLE
jgi:hypothetical protein